MTYTPKRPTHLRVIDLHGYPAELLPDDDPDLERAAQEITLKLLPDGRDLKFLMVLTSNEDDE